MRIYIKLSNCLNHVNLFFLLLVAVTGNARSNFEKNDSINITYIANEGFLISGAKGKILIDAIFTEDWDKYHAPTEETLLKERNAESPFDSIDILLVSHNHADHIEPGYVTEHMVNDGECPLVCPQQVKDLLSGINDYHIIESRIFAKNPSGQSRIDTTIGDIPVSIMSFDHADDDGSTQNLGFILSLNGFKIFHPGDAISNDLNPYQSLNIADDSIDIAFIPRWFFDDEYGVKGPDILRYINPKAIIPMHINVDKYRYYRDQANSIEGISPVYFMEIPMTEIGFTKQDDDLIVTGINNLQNGTHGKKLINLFPNPTNGIFRIGYNGNPGKDSRLEIYSMDNRQVFTKTIYHLEEESFDLTGFPAGLYAVKIITDGKIHEALIIKE